MIRETRAVNVPTTRDEVRRAVTFALTQQGFDFARHEPGYIEARRGTIDPMRVVSRMKVKDTPIVVCVSIEATEGGDAELTVGAYPDLGRGVLMGPVARRKWRAALIDAVVTVCEAALGAPTSAVRLTAPAVAEDAPQG